MERYEVFGRESLRRDRKEPGRCRALPALRSAADLRSTKRSCWGPGLWDWLVLGSDLFRIGLLVHSYFTVFAEGRLAFLQLCLAPRPLLYKRSLAWKALLEVHGETRQRRNDPRVFGISTIRCASHHS